MAGTVTPIPPSTNVKGTSIPKLNLSHNMTPATQVAVLNRWADQVGAGAGAISNVVGGTNIRAVSAGNTANTALNTANQAIAKSFQGAWSATVSYAVGATVELSSTIYLCISANINEMPPNATYWLQLSGSVSYAGAWSSVLAYTVGQIVSVSSSLYIALQNNTNKNPASTTGYWQLLTGTSIYEGAWNSGTAYSVGQTVSYTDGNFYICISGNTNETPAPISSTYWTLLGTSNTLIGAYSGSTAYVAGNEVTNSGNIFQALQATTGNAPPTPPATNVYWQLMGPSNLSNVPDGGGIYGGTTAGLSYRPNTNPLTSVNAGSNATVDIASFSLVVRNRTITSDVSYNSGSITSLSYGTVYYIYCNDPTLAGGSVTYQASTTKTTVLTNSGYVFVGSILTAISGGQETIGNNDGGSGAQYGQQTLFLGSTAGTATTGSGSITNPTNAIDGNITTEATVTAGTTNPSTATLTISGYSGYQLQGVGVLNVWSSVTFATALDVSAVLRYSLNGGSTWTNFYDVVVNRSLTQDQVTLPINQNLALVQVQAIATADITTVNAVVMDIYEAYITLTQ